MKSIDILKAMNDIDDKYIEEAMPLVYKKEKRHLFKYLPALFGLVFVTIFGIKMINMNMVKDNAQVVNPLVEYSSLKEAEKSIGFEFGLDLSEYDNLSFIVIDNEILEITYINNNDNLICRKAKGNKDISGDYNKYININNTNIDGVEVCVKQNDDNTLITFSYNDYSYSFSSNYLKVDKMLDFVKEIIK